ncbi:MAG TPA: hypothetical protein VLF94_01685 [Chlamydiales bacterium]|nr:hypothetical protein [Chlamydiales bacterium]
MAESHTSSNTDNILVDSGEYDPKDGEKNLAYCIDPHTVKTEGIYFQNSSGGEEAELIKGEEEIE